MRHLAILGSTGSIGTQTLEVVENNEDMKVVALAAGSNIDLVEQQIRKFHPEVVCIYREEKARELARRVADENVSVLYGMDGLTACATVASADVVVAAVVGMIGIRPVIEAIKNGKDIAFANKETLVTAGHIIMPMIKQHQVLLTPVDSEHAAIFQCLNGEHHGEISKILLTASGGPFRGKKREELAHVTVEDALKHPNWSMGRKITIDSSTMVNKGLEVMEARWLFDVDYDHIQVVIQPQSVIHSMVEFVDGAVMAQLGTPDMKLPIQYALYYPERRHIHREEICRESVLIFRSLQILPLKSRIRKPSVVLPWRMRRDVREAVCRRCLMLPMRKQLRCFWIERSVTWIFLRSLRNV